MPGKRSDMEKFISCTQREKGWEEPQGGGGRERRERQTWEERGGEEGEVGREKER